MYSFPNFEPVHCSMSSSNCCFLTCLQVSQEISKMIWYSHLLKNFPQFVVIHTVKGFSIVNEAEVDVWNSLAFSMIQQMLAIWFLVPLPFLYPACTSGISELNCLYFFHNSSGSETNHLINNYTLTTPTQAYYITKEALTEWISLRQSPSSKFNSAVTDYDTSPSQALILSKEVLLIGGCDGNSCYPLMLSQGLNVRREFSTVPGT